jgi:hypothetical protein
MQGLEILRADAVWPLLVDVTVADRRIDAFLTVRLLISPVGRSLRSAALQNLVAIGA